MQTAPIQEGERLIKTLFVFDIDGTLAHAGRRFEIAGPEPLRTNRKLHEDWVTMVQDEESLLADKPVPGMLDMCWHLSNTTTAYLTSREERWRKVTEDWLSKHDFPSVELVMRSASDFSEGADFKEAAIQQLKYRYKATNVVVIDDDEHGTIEAMCNKNGWTFLKARSGGQR